MPPGTQQDRPALLPCPARTRPTVRHASQLFFKAFLRLLPGFVFLAGCQPCEIHLYWVDVPVFVERDGNLVRKAVLRVIHGTSLQGGGQNYALLLRENSFASEWHLNQAAAFLQKANKEKFFTIFSLIVGSLLLHLQLL